MTKAETRLTQDLDIIKFIGKVHTVEDLKRNTFDSRES